MFPVDVGGSRPVAIVGGSRPVAIMGGSRPVATMGGSRPVTIMGGSRPVTIMGGSRPVATTDGTDPVPPVVRKGDVLKVTFSALDADGHPVEALLPAEIRLYDAAGREIDGAGWVCLQGGTCTVEFVTNVNDADGDYRIVCRDRASGLSAERTIKVNLKTDATYMP